MTGVERTVIPPDQVVDAGGSSAAAAGGLAVEYWPPEKLVPYARNARTHSDAQVAEIAGSIKAFGFTNPILTGADGSIVAGHGRLAAATTLWSIPSRDQDADTIHGTQKPVECMRRPTLNNSSPGQAVYDPFLGSGTTLIAAEATGRVCHAVELDPVYVDVAIRRWQVFTGQRATLLAGGQTFEAVSAERFAGGGAQAPVGDNAATEAGRAAEAPAAPPVAHAAAQGPEG